MLRLTRDDIIAAMREVRSQALTDLFAETEIAIEALSKAGLYPEAARLKSKLRWVEEIDRRAAALVPLL